MVVVVRVLVVLVVVLLLLLLLLRTHLVHWSEQSARVNRFCLKFRWRWWRWCRFCFTCGRSGLCCSRYG